MTVKRSYLMSAVALLLLNLSPVNCPHSLATWLVRFSVFPVLQNRPSLA